MKVKNDFPKADRVLSKLRDYVDYFENRKNTQTDHEEKEFCDDALGYVDEYISSIEKYLDSVCNAEDRISRVRREATEIEEIQYEIENEDKMRTLYHSSIIMTMVMIDRISSIYGINKVFDYTDEFEQDYSKLTPSSVEEKSLMTERQRIKRREMGNFGLYIAASVTAGMHKEYMISDDEAREFASCESDNIKTDISLTRKVKDISKQLKNNMNKIIE